MPTFLLFGLLLNASPLASVPDSTIPSDLPPPNQLFLMLEILQTYDYNAADPANPLPSSDQNVDFFTRTPGGPYEIAAPTGKYALRLRGLAYEIIWIGPFPIAIPLRWNLYVRGNGPFSNGATSFALSNLEWKKDASPTWTPMSTTDHLVYNGYGVDIVDVDYRLTIPYTAPPGNGYSTTIRYTLIPTLSGLRNFTPPQTFYTLQNLTTWAKDFGPLPNGTLPYIHLVTETYTVFPGIPFAIPFSLQNPSVAPYEARITLEMPRNISLQTTPTGWASSRGGPNTWEFTNVINPGESTDFSPTFEVTPGNLTQTTFSFQWQAEVRAGPTEPWTVLASGRGRLKIHTFPFSTRGRILGVVLFKGKPVEGQTIHLSNGLKIVTDSLGRFAFDLLAPGYYALWIEDGPNVQRKVVHLRKGETRWFVFERTTKGDFKTKEFFTADWGIGIEDHKIYMTGAASGRIHNFDLKLSMDTRNPTYFEDPDETVPISLYPYLGSPLSSSNEAFQLSVRGPSLRMEGGRLPINFGFPLLAADMEGLRYRVGSRFFFQGQVGLPSRNLRKDQFRSLGTPGPYHLTAPPIRPLTEQIFLEYRTSSGTVVEIQPVATSEYVLDYEQGILLFHTPIPRTHSGLEVWIVAIYETRGLSPRPMLEQFIQQHEVGVHTTHWTVAGGIFRFPSTQKSFYTSRIRYSSDGLMTALKSGWRTENLGFLNWDLRFHPKNSSHSFDIEYRYRGNLWRILPPTYAPSPYQWSWGTHWKHQNNSTDPWHHVATDLGIRVIGSDGRRFIEGTANGEFGPWGLSLTGLWEPHALWIQRWKLSQKKGTQRVSLSFGVGFLQDTIPYSEAGLGVDVPIGSWQMNIQGRLAHEGRTPRLDLTLDLIQNRAFQIFLTYQQKPGYGFTQIGGQWNLRNQKSMTIGNMGVTRSDRQLRLFGFFQGYRYVSNSWGFYGSVIAGGESRIGIFVRPVSKPWIQLLASALWGKHSYGAALSGILAPTRRWSLNTEYRGRGKIRQISIFSDWEIGRGLGITLGWEEEPKLGLFWETSGLGIRMTYGKQQKWKISSFLSFFQIPVQKWSLPDRVEIIPNASSLAPSETLRLKIRATTQDGQAYQGPVEVFVDSQRIAELWFSSSDSSKKTLIYPLDQQEPGIHRITAKVQKTSLGQTWVVVRPPNQILTYQLPTPLLPTPKGPPTLGDLDVRILKMEAETAWVEIIVWDQWGRIFQDYEGNVFVWTSNHVTVSPHRIPFLPEDHGVKRVKLLLQGAESGDRFRLIFRATYSRNQTRYALSEPLSMRP